ncbi:trimeric intracellular cation channel family protein [Terrimonas sp. NA20]|uniref:Trimeric intracellular cation channel family protein n=1 Tax=Terrimonas ginsenosidimutans TaxID=2908004 RepID=A0ABS9KXS2_9BACT|nr:trimeric intracellular cation channel family protein [Terrimonas ginsenosidimutans]MCG2617189.1 trimeric intracellular cation channel family protein [Terrimonas ginsenosidimutans]
MDFLYLIDILGTFAFAVSGAFFAMEKKLDPFGVLILSFITAIGGGTLRDMMIGDLPVGWLRNPTATIVIFSSAIASMFFGSFIRKFNMILFVFDALGLGLFTFIGIEKGIQMNFSIGVSIALGTITACFGGVIRDVILNTVPLVFRKEIYALASIIGGLLYFLFLKFGIDNDLAKIVCILVIFVIRIIAVRFHLGLPRFYNRDNRA